MRSPIARLPKLRPGHAATEPHSKDMLTTGCNEAFRGWLDRSDRLFPILSSCRALRSRFVDEGERAQIPSRLGEGPFPRPDEAGYMRAILSCLQLVKPSLYTGLGPYMHEDLRKQLVLSSDVVYAVSR